MFYELRSSCSSVQISKCGLCTSVSKLAVSRSPASNVAMVLSKDELPIASPSQAQLFDKCLIALQIVTFQVVQQFAPAVYFMNQAAARVVIFFM